MGNAGKSIGTDEKQNRSDGTRWIRKSASFIKPAACVKLGGCFHFVGFFDWAPWGRFLVLCLSICLFVCLSVSEVFYEPVLRTILYTGATY